jgi:hypothetical protein
MHIPSEIETYHQRGRPLVCELGAERSCCEFWPLDELLTYNQEYEVPKYAPGYFGFASNGGGEMYALSPTGAVVRLPFIGMEPKAARTLAFSWPEFEGKLRRAL